ncbi:MAG TPA: ABC transporter ATP-binding protein, partial [Planctomycetaceae bacterium]|nr:ABC transporter ATP-binding protein [Planctomycetaceae bacterium]
MPTSDISALSSVEPPSNWSLISRMLGLSWRYRWGCTQVVLLQIVVVAFGLGGLGLTGVGIDLIGHELQSPETPRHLPALLRFAQEWSGIQILVLIAGCILAVALVTAALRYATAIAVASLSQQVLVQLRSDVYDKLQRLSFRFFDRSQSSSIINRAAGDVNAVRQFVDGVIVKVLTVVLSLAVYVAYMWSMHVLLTLVCLATSPLLWWAAARFSRIVQPEYIKGGELVDRMVLTLVENVQGIS